MSQSLPLTRTRLIALLIIAALSFSAVTALAVFNASPAGAAKKSKKCKKGYKKVKGKCKKTKKKKSGVIELPPAPAPPSVGGASTSNAVISAKKKSKKCKKGYKKVKGKCKKKKKAAGSATVSSITIDSFQPSAYKATLKGTITLKKPVASLKVTVKCTRQGYSESSDTTVASDGVALSISYTANVSPGCIRMPGRGDIDYFAIADGVSSKAY